ncbi:MAG: bacteriophage abortive infection AbiH family protein [Lachnospiraceae bacterium]|nr:bacteriophage abortive infection AbiH family protein [Lachnospiraceae bacterium]
MFKKLTASNHNIMCLVGNGFDIGALEWLNTISSDEIAKSGLGKETGTSYPDFYNYIIDSDHPERKEKFRDNRVFKQIELDFQEHEKNKNSDDENIRNAKKNWADFESTVDKMLFGENPNKIMAYHESECKKIEEDLLQLQREFSTFLNDLLPINKIVEFDKKVSEGKYAFRSLQSFLRDLSYKDASEKTDNIYFPKYVSTGDKLNYLFVDFNYTMLLDSYINLDREQFTVKKFKKSPNNFDFMPNPKYAVKQCYEYEDGFLVQTQISTQVVHPHGIQSVPRSILFGTEKKGNNKSNNEQFTSDDRWRLIKSLWAQDKEKYFEDIQQTQLFILFGMSISSVDGWWMTQIYRRLSNYYKDNWRKPELIIYNHYKSGRNSDDVRKAFRDACIYLDDYEKKDFLQKRVDDRIQVITFGDDNRPNVFLGFPNKDPNKNSKAIAVFKAEK